MVNCISATQFKQLVDNGNRLEVIDVRTPVEFQSVHVTVARNCPLDRLDPAAIQSARNGSADEPLYIVCRSGARGRQACERFIGAGYSNVINVEGGTSACELAGIDVVKGKKSMPINCQVQVIVGTLVVVGSALCYVNPMWAWLPGAMGAGLLFSGLTDSCVMGMVLSRMPWNQVRQSSFLALLAIVSVISNAFAQPAANQGGDNRHDDDHVVFQYLLTNHEKIHRTVKETAEGVETLTESNDPAVAAKIKEHVHWMQDRVEKVTPIRMRDPLFRELFKNAKAIKMVHTETDKGVKVTESSTDPKVVKLIQAHARVVSGFVERGFAEAMKNHAVPNPDAEPLKTQTPVIKQFGKVTQLPNATHQPRADTKLLVDVTRGGKPEELNAALDKLAKYLNIYAGAGAQPVKLSMAVVFHGEATSVVLNADAYRAKFKTQNNPNLDLLHQLHEAGVELNVCGQSLISNGDKPEDVAVFVDTAVSAVTAIANLQADGYSYISIGK